MRNLVLQKNELMELEGSVDRIGEYDFFDLENKREARDLSEAVLHAVYNNEPRQAVIQAQELRAAVNYDKSLKAIDLLRGRGIEVKPFCFYSSAQDEIFVVKSRDMDWMVTPLSESDERIPVEFIRNLTYLKLKGIKSDGVAIATPNKQTPLSRIIGEVLKEEAQRVGRASRVVFKAIADFSTGVSDRMQQLAIERERRISERRNSHLDKAFPDEAAFLLEPARNTLNKILADFWRKFDPILLIKIGSSDSFYIEAGRWL